MAPPKKNRARLGGKVRTLRRRRAWTQAQLAQRLGISASYLNLIENNRRPLTAQVLIAMTRELGVSAAEFGDDDTSLVQDLNEVFSDDTLEEYDVTTVDVRELAASAPAAATAVVALYRDLAAQRAQNQILASRLADDDPAQTVALSVSPSEEVSDFLQANHNHFPVLEDAAEKLWATAKLDNERKFDSLSRALHEAGVVVVISQGQDEPLRVYDPHDRVLRLSEQLAPRSRHFQMAHQFALLTLREPIDALVESAHLTGLESRALCRVALANYFAGAVLMPYAPFIAAAEELRYDIELLGHRFRTSYEQVVHRMTTLRRRGNEGVAFHFLRVDVAGNISKRFSGSGIRFARFAGACPKWNVFTAFATPETFRIQISEMPDGSRYFCVARTVTNEARGFHRDHVIYAIGLGCKLEDAHKVVYAEGMRLEDDSGIVPIGVTCRLCERANCVQRAVPSLAAPFHVDENLRRTSFYASGGRKDPQSGTP